MLNSLMKMSRFKFRLLVAVLTTVLFVAVALATYGIHNKAVKTVLKESRGEELAMARTGAVMIEKFISNLFIHLDNVGYISAVEQTADLESSMAFKAVYGTLRDQVESVSRFDPSGRLVGGYRGQFEPVETGYFDVFEEAILQDLERRKKHVWNPIPGQNGVPVILLSYPIFNPGSTGDDSTYAGIIVAEIKPEKLIEIISAHSRARKNEYLAVIGPAGDVIASSRNPGMVCNNVFDEQGNCAECHKNMSVVRDIVRSGGGTAVIEGTNQDENLVAYVKMTGENPGWLVGVYSDYTAVLESVKAISWYAVMITLIGGIILIPGTLILFLFSRKREEAEERSRYLEKEKKLLEIIREADREISGHNRELTVLNKLASDVNKTLVLQDVLGISLDKTLEITSLANGAIYLLDVEDNVLKLKSHRGLSEDVVKAVERISIGQSLTGKVAETGEPVFIESIVSDPRCEIEILKEEGFQSYVGIPLLHGAKLIGVIEMGGKEIIRLDGRKKRWLSSIGSIIGMAIGNCMLYQEVGSKAEEMSILFDVGKDLTSTIELSKLGEIVINTLRDRLDYPACTLLLPSRTSEEMHIFVTSYAMEKSLGERGFVTGKDGVTGWVAQTKETLYVPDVKAEDRYIKGREETRAELSIPLVFGDELLGVLDFEKDHKNSFSEDEIRFLSLFANQLSVALYNVNMFEETIRMNKELNRMSEMKSEFVSLVSHELRTPLTAIKSSIDIILLKMSDTLNENVTYFLQMAKANVDRLSNMIDNILDISRIESGRMQFSLTSLDIKEPAKKAINNVTPLAIQKGLTLEDEIIGDLPMVMADGDKVVQVFTNLLGNAIKFTPKGGTIRVRAERKIKDELSDEIKEKIKNGHSRFIQVTVQDTGPGIPEKEHEEIFKRFRRFEKGGGKGTGLGLSISKHVVESHGGGVWVESEPGKGSSFKFLIPLSKEEHSEN